jgi:hypothetical protein
MKQDVVEFIRRPKSSTIIVDPARRLQGQIASSKRVRSKVNINMVRQRDP